MTQQPPSVETKPVNRREFLNYIFGASIGLLLAEAGGAAVWFALPHYPKGYDNGVYHLTPAEIPSSEAAPAIHIAAPQKAFWLRHMNKGLMAFNIACPYKGCYFKWVESIANFACPCCGSRFTQDGDHIFGPARRNLDRYLLKVRTPNDIRQTSADGGPVSVEGAIEIIVDTRYKILGQTMPQFPV